MLSRSLIAVVCLAVLSACTGDPPSAPAASGPPDDAPSAAEPALTGLDVDGLAVDAPALPLADEAQPPPTQQTLYELVAAGAEAGRWSLGDGVAQALRWAAGLVDDPALVAAVGDSELELTGLLAVAAELSVDESVPDATRDELTAVLSVLAPTQATLDAVSEAAAVSLGAPVSRDTATGRLVAATARIAAAAAPGAGANVSAACSDAAAEGLTADAIADGDPCYLWVERIVAGNRLRVYYPYEWGDDGSDDRQELAFQLLDAMDVSTQAFTPYGDVGDVNLAISLLDDATSSSGWQYAVRGEDVCQTVIAPAGLEAGRSAWEQTVAHELFHCVQDRNFTTTPYDSHRWWAEGSAEFFSNVAFPTNQDEHARAADFSRRSLRETPFDLSYENTVWFQHLANERGVQGLWDLLQRVTPGGAGSAPSALADEPDMARSWHDFVVFLNSQTIADTAGGPLPVGDSVVSEVEEVDRAGSITMEMQPWVAGRVALRYVPARTFDQRFDLDGEGDFSVVEGPDRRNPAAYGEPPEEVFTSCDKRRLYGVVLTSIEEDVSLELTVEDVQRAVCDGCVVGEWELDVDRFGEAVLQAMQSQGADVGGVTVTGSGSATFEADGTFSARRDVEFNFPLGSAPFGVNAGDGSYEADGETITLPDENGRPRGSAYTCDFQELVILEAEIGEIRYVRVFDDIDPEERAPPEPEPVQQYSPGR